jgi:hypothetical protein
METTELVSLSLNRRKFSLIDFQYVSWNCRQHYTTPTHLHKTKQKTSRTTLSTAGHRTIIHHLKSSLNPNFAYGTPITTSPAFHLNGTIHPTLAPYIRTIADTCIDLCCGTYRLVIVVVRIVTSKNGMLLESQWRDG